MSKPWVAGYQKEVTGPDDNRRKRLLYQAQHRGCKEADLLIGGFAAAHLAAMSEADLDAFETLLSYPDHDLMAWIKGGTAAPTAVRGRVFDALASFDIPGSLSL